MHSNYRNFAIKCGVPDKTVLGCRTSYHGQTELNVTMIVYASVVNVYKSRNRTLFLGNGVNGRSMYIQTFVSSFYEDILFSNADWGNVRHTMAEANKNLSASAMIQDNMMVLQSGVTGEKSNMKNAISNRLITGIFC